MRNQNFGKMIFGLASLAMMVNVASAGFITTHDIPETGSDAGSGISSSNAYTHALDFGSGSWGANYQINGVTFTHLNSVANNSPGFSGTDATTGKGFSLVANAYAIQQYSGGTSTHADGQVGNLLNDFVTMGNWADMVLTLSDLTVGENYSTRFYYRPWIDNDSRTDTLTFNGDGTADSTTFNEDAGSSAHYISYDFTASGSTEVITIGKQFHLYGVTNQVLSAIPEPANAIPLGSLLASALLLRTRRRDHVA
jgi:hypothetical protein